MRIIGGRSRLRGGMRSRGGLKIGERMGGEGIKGGLLCALTKYGICERGGTKFWTRYAVERLLVEVMKSSSSLTLISAGTYVG